MRRMTAPEREGSKQTLLSVSYYGYPYLSVSSLAIQVYNAYNNRRPCNNYYKHFAPKRYKHYTREDFNQDNFYHERLRGKR